jgi:hypothetical protein
MNVLEKAIINNQKYQKQMRKEKYTRPELFRIIENFMMKYRLIGYGGMAINSLLPIEKQFYTDIDVPDYDFFSYDAEKHAIELANLIYNLNNEVDVKSALFEGTYKIFVNSIPIVDVTQIEKELFDNLHKNAVFYKGIYYAPYNYLRLSMYQELSRPLGDITRWSKVFQRLNLLNEIHPIMVRNCNIKEKYKLTSDNKNIFYKIVDRMKPFVWSGDYAMYYYQHLFPKKYQLEQQHCLYVHIENENDVWKLLKDINYKTVKHSNKLITFYQVFVNDIPMLYVILMDSCQSYNTIDGLKIATIDTIFSLYYTLSFMNLDTNKILSYCFLLSQIKETNDPIMKRFSMPCVGKQKSYEQLRQERDKKYKIYKKTGKYRELFVRYKPKTRRIIKKSTKIK